MKPPIFPKIVDYTLTFLFEIKPNVIRFVLFLFILVYIGYAESNYSLSSMTGPIKAFSFVLFFIIIFESSLLGNLYTKKFGGWWGGGLIVLSIVATKALFVLVNYYQIEPVEKTFLLGLVVTIGLVLGVFYDGQFEGLKKVIKETKKSR